MKSMNTKYLLNAFSTILLIGIFSLLTGNTFAEYEKNNPTNVERKEEAKGSNDNIDSEQNIKESDDPAGPRDRDPSEIELPSDEDSDSAINPNSDKTRY
ncbi:hypothetical protein [Nitrosomonas supralitoralis]|uniref:Uncharacterized protein n=1 Tax=Nitrosomonas supralitoralis TaxID=2116706 RepID=A0A2P7NR93_9PROT|nr:hypothetical protein [Nitrosomonas supralitoralis]PSJ16001.1 hypothetical protein C7H79_15975 [Nitrosomonas supralitoralis]